LSLPPLPQTAPHPPTSRHEPTPTPTSTTPSRAKSKERKEKAGKGRNASGSSGVGSNSTSSTSKDAAIDEDGEYEIIEELLDKRTTMDGETIYLCRWKGLEPHQDTWEPSTHILCREMIVEFETEWQNVEESNSISASTKPGSTKSGSRKQPVAGRKGSAPAKGKGRNGAGAAVESGSGSGKRRASSDSGGKGAKKSRDAGDTCYGCEKTFPKSKLKNLYGDMYCAECLKG
jgi:hypothetical protein